MSALILIDLQNSFSKTVTDELISHISQLTKHFRYKRLPIIWVSSIYLSENMSNNEDYSLDSIIERTHSGKSKICIKDCFSSEYIAAIKKLMCDKNDYFMIKNWYSCFKETQLNDLLTKLNVVNLTFCGVTTNMCVLAGSYDASKRGYNVNIASDCVNAFSQYRHMEALKKMKSYATIKTNNEIINELTTFCEGDTKIIYDVVDDTDINFDAIKNEVEWHQMNQHGKPISRLVSVQGTIEGELEPLYRKPSDEQPKTVKWTPLINKLRLKLMGIFKQELNHAFIQLYRNGDDYIGDHADKTLDIKKGSKIINYSLGATRTMVLKPKPNYNKTKEKVLLINNSVISIGWDTNIKWTHGVPQDKRHNKEKRSDELRNDGERISIVFRHIATFINELGIITGQGAPVNKQIDDSLELVKAFGLENRDANFNWDEIYGKGFNTINLKNLVK